MFLLQVVHTKPVENGLFESLFKESFVWLSLEHSDKDLG